MAGEDVGVHAGGRASAGVAGGVTVKGLGPQPARSRNSAARLENHGVREIPDADKGHPRRDRPPFPSHSRAFRRDKLRHGPRFHSRPLYASDSALSARSWFQRAVRRGLGGVVPCGGPCTRGQDTVTTPATIWVKHPIGFGLEAQLGHSGQVVLPIRSRPNCASNRGHGTWPRQCSSPAPSACTVTVIASLDSPSGGRPPRSPFKMGEASPCP